MSRRVIIGAIGGGDQRAIGRAFGGAVANAGCILLTGGDAQDTDQIKDATMMGAIQAEGGGVAARLIGIVPGRPIRWDRRRWGLLLHTGLPHYVRNVINGMTPDVVVAFGGSRGTLAEVAFARAAGKEVFFLGAIRRLRENFAAHLQLASGEDFTTYFEQPIATYPAGVGNAGSAKGLVTLLGETLDRATDTELPLDALVGHIAKRRVVDATGFPGLPGDSKSKMKFEDVIEQISS